MAKITSGMFMRASGFVGALVIADHIVHVMQQATHPGPSGVVTLLDGGPWAIVGCQVALDGTSVPAQAPDQIRAETNDTGDLIRLKGIVPAFPQDDQGQILAHSQAVVLTGNREARRESTKMIVGALVHEATHCLTRRADGFDADTWQAAAAASRKAYTTQQPADYATYVNNLYELHAHTTQLVAMLLVGRSAAALADAAEFEFLLRGSWLARYIVGWPNPPAAAPAQGHVIDQMWARAPKIRDRLLS
jgi:hypothetical protein